MKKLFICALFNLIGIASFAQFQNIPLVTVYGESVVKVKPDFVVLEIKLTKDIFVENQNNSIFEIFSKEDTQINIFDFDGKQVSEAYIQVDSLRYYKELFMTIKDLTKLDKILLELYKAGFKNYVFVDFRTSKKTDLINQARKDAIAAATNKAKLLANETGQLIGKVNTIEEIGSQEYNWYNLHKINTPDNNMYRLGSDNYIIEPGYITVVAKVKVSFDLLK